MTPLREFDDNMIPKLVERMFEPVQVTDHDRKRRAHLLNNAKKRQNIRRICVSSLVRRYGAFCAFCRNARRPFRPCAGFRCAATGKFVTNVKFGRRSCVFVDIFLQICYNIIITTKCSSYVRLQKENACRGDRSSRKGAAAVAEAKKQTTVDGLRAVELQYRVIREISGGHVAFYQSQTHLNSPALGVLTPDKFRAVSEMTTQAVRLFYLELTQALDAAGKFTERELDFNWLSVYMPARFLAEEKGDKALAALCARHQVPTSRVCFELSETLLASNEPEYAAAITRMRNLGFHFMLTGFGATTCPMMRLSDFPVDYVMLSPEVTHYIGRDERSDNAVKSIIDFVNDLDAEPIADGVQNSRQAETFYSFECTYCAGSLAGKYMAERYVRRKSDT